MKNIQLAVITNKPIVLAWRILEGLGLDYFFSLVLGGDSLPEKKLSPLPLQHALNFSKLSARDSVMVSDSKVDISAAQAAQAAEAVDYGYSNGVPVKN